jgi:ABC-2 type transport system permease protein
MTVMTRLGGDGRAFLAAARREWRTLCRYPFEFFSAVFWPLLLPPFYLLMARAFGSGPQSLAAFSERTGTEQVALFLYVGWAVSHWLAILLYGPGAALRRDKVQGTLESVFLTPVSRSVLLFGPVPAYLVPTLWMWTVVGATLRFGFGVPISGEAALRALVIIVCSVPALAGISALFSAAVLRFRDTSALVQAVRGLFLIFCGITYPVVVLPGWAQAIAVSLPPTHVVSSLRSALLGVADLARFTTTLLVLGVAGVALFALAAALLRWSERHAVRTGSLGQH